MQLKTDAHLFNEIIESIKKQVWLGNRKWWPNYLFHFTDIKNAVNILSIEKILSRENINQLGGMKNENASPDVISNTESKWKKYARFYFRPRTPTQFRNEGFRPVSERQLGAHCPMPIFFVFNSLPLLTRHDSEFSYGSLANADAVTYNTAEKFQEMPFQYIYHEGPYDTINQHYIKSNRHAELIIPNECNLDDLFRIVCRSHAEKETFLFLLDSATRKKWRKFITVDTSGKFYYSQWTFVDKALLSPRKITFNLNRGNRVTGTFNYLLKIVEQKTGKLFTAKREKYSPQDTLVFDLQNLKFPNNYKVDFYLDGDLAYSNHYIERADDDLPF